MFSKLVNKINKTVENPLVDTKLITKGKTMDEMIEEIHENFYTEVDKLLAEAKISKSLETTKQDLIDKSNRLKALGFTFTKEVQEAQQEIDRLNKLKIENDQKQSLVDAINYFSFNYPQYKFITEDSVKKICAKYNLIYGTIDKYIGTVPEINLKQMESFKIKEEDELWEAGYYSMNLDWDTGRYVKQREVRKYLTKQIALDKIKNDGKHGMHLSISSITPFTEKAPLEIAAPISDFDTENMELKNFKLSNIIIPDPVVLCPVLFKKEKYYLVVCAWGGPEASDELVINEKMN